MLLLLTLALVDKVAHADDSLSAPSASMQISDSDELETADTDLIDHALRSQHDFVLFSFPPILRAFFLLLVLSLYARPRLRPPLSI